MIRKEQIKQAAEAFDIKIISNPWTLFEKGAQWADEHPRWISVEDELPSLYDDYLVCTSGNIIEISHFNIDGWHNESAGKVTHWMSLPGLPEKGG